MRATPARATRSVTLLLALILLLSPAVARADAFLLLDGEREAMQLLVDLIQNARREILATYFIVGKDDIPISVLSLLRDAARRGVAVRLVVDAQWNRLPKVIQAHLIAEGIEIREYHPFRLTKPFWLTRRLHDKLLVVDGEHMVTGGRNLEAPYFGFGERVERRDYLDRDAYVRGEAAARARDYFEELWGSREVRRTGLNRFRPRNLHRDCSRERESCQRPVCERQKERLREEMAEAGRRLDGLRGELRASGLAELDRRVALGTIGREVGPVRFLHDPVGRKDPIHGIGAQLLALLYQAEKEVMIESPYLVPSRALRRGLVRARERGVRVRILTNSLAVTDNIFPQAGYVGRKKWILRQGVELWEYAGPECLHSKTAVMDGRVLVVGTFNLDPRSEHLNSEVAVVVEDGRAAAEAKRVMDAHLARAVRVGQDGRPIPGPVELPKASCGKKLGLALLRLVSPFIHKQL